MRGWLIGLAAIVLASCSSPPGGFRAAASSASWLTDCALPQVDGHARCGTFEVVENRINPDRRIALNVVVLSATGSKRQPDAFLPLSGGPGQAATPLAGMFSQVLAEVRRARDIVLVDVRGTGKSNPLSCDIASPPWARSLDLMPPDAIRGCRADLERRADLRSYTTAAIAQDLDEVRAALGIEMWNIFGASYGTRLAQEYTRAYGPRVRTMTLHGIAPPSMAIPLPYARDAQQAVDKLLDAPTRATLTRVLAQLTREPAIVPTATNEVAVSAGELSEALRNMLYNARSATAATAMIDAASNGDYRAAAQAVMRQREGFSSDIALGMFLSVTCAEDIPRITEAAIAEATRDTFMGDYRVRQQMAACRNWFSGDIAAAPMSPLRSEVPSLLISGEVDPVTPPANGDEVARTLPNARHLVIPGHGHTMSLGQPCINAALQRFLSSANARSLDFSCLQQSDSRAPVTEYRLPITEYRLPSTDYRRPKLLDNDALADGVEDDFGGVVQIELLHQVRAMRLYGREAQLQDRRDFLVRAPLGEQLEDFLLAIGEQVIRVGETLRLQAADVIFDEHRGHRGTEERLAGADRTHGGQQVLVGRILQQIRTRAGGQRANDVRLVRVHAQDDRLRRALEFLRPGGDVDAVQFRHPDVEDQQVGLMFRRQPQRLQTIGGFGDHGQPGLALEQRAKAAADDAVVVSQQYAQVASPFPQIRAVAGSAVTCPLP